MRKVFIYLIVTTMLVLLLCSCTKQIETNNQSESIQFDNTSDSSTKEVTANTQELTNMDNSTANTILSSMQNAAFPLAQDVSTYSLDSFYCLTGCVPDMEIHNFDDSFVLPNVVSKSKTKDFEYSVRENNAVEITRWLNTTEHINVPSFVNDMPVLYIGREAFKNSAAKEVVLPESIIAIGDCAFYEAQNLEKMDCPKKLISLSAYAFYNCPKLRSVSLPDCLQAIGEKAFYNCCLLESINTPSDIRLIAREAFHSCEVLRVSLDFSENLYEVATGAFEFSGIESVTFSEGVYSIDAGAFRGCANLKEAILPKRMIDSENGLGWGTFSDCISLEEVTIPENLIGIPSNMFDNCRNLKSIRIPARIETLLTDVFKGCIKLKDIYFDSADCAIYYNSFIFTPGLTVHAPKGGSVEKFFRFRPLVKFVATN